VLTRRACASLSALGVLSVIGVLASFSPSAAAATARAASNDTTLHACYNKHSGALRISKNGSCHHGEQAISWSSSGPAGAAGAAGPQGPQGAQGPPGMSGSAGAQGTPGTTGPTGAPGVAGTTGATGPAGSAGPMGPTGATGPAGATGAAGVTGATGTTGPTGPAGPTGATGPTGSGGAGGTGATGPTGPSGSTGATGASTPIAGPLGAGESETGVWATSSPGAAEEGHVATATISFPVPLAEPITGAEHVIYLPTNTTNANCPGTPAEPAAAAGYLCVYAALEENDFSKFSAIENAAGETEKSSRGGAFVVFEPEEPGPESPSYILSQGTWAVRAS
jgi:Collagen triple helix repeat (20 copies)